MTFGVDAAHRGTRAGQAAARRDETQGGSRGGRAQLDDFIGAIRERRAPFVTAESALHALSVIETAYARRTPMAQPWLARVERSA